MTAVKSTKAKSVSASAPKKTPSKKPAGQAVKQASKSSVKSVSVSSSANKAVTSGRRKTAVSRVFVREGSGNFVVNGKSFDQYFVQPRHLSVVRYLMSGAVEGFDFSKYDVVATVEGGGLSAQAYSVLHGLAKALDEFGFRSQLKSKGLLRVDARKKERKKVGLRAARKRQQYTKR